MSNPLLALLRSRKFLVLFFSQVALAVPAAFKIIPPENAATLGIILVGVWQYAHAHEEKSKIEATAVIAQAIAADPTAKKDLLPLLPQSAGPSSDGAK